ncbi:MAG: aldehyde dehydrogenase family protein, partial [Pseudomonadota bacterium]
MLKQVPLVERLTDRSLLKLQAYINGKFVGAASTTVKNPANGQVIAAVPNLGAQDATIAIEAAYAALRAWSERTCKERSAILRRWFELVTAAREDLAIILTSEQGKPLAEARGEIDYAAAYIEFYAEEAKRVVGEILPSHRTDARLLVQRRPIGVVAAITPWNFPAAMITRKIAPALAAGCTVVVKPAP